MKIVFFSLWLMVLGGCGDSPFLKEGKAPENPVAQAEGLGLGLVFNDLKITIRPYWRVGPRVGDECKLLIVLVDEAGTPLTDEIELELMLWMPSMGHGSFPITTRKVGDGLYESTEIFFTMPGDWDVHFQIKDGENLLDEVKWSFIL